MVVSAKEILWGKFKQQKDLKEMALRLDLIKCNFVCPIEDVLPS
jgi:hypothetical protein